MLNEKEEWYLTTAFISILFSFWFLIIPLIVGIMLIKKKQKYRDSLINEYKNVVKVGKLKDEKSETYLGIIVSLNTEIESLVKTNGQQLRDFELSIQSLETNLLEKEKELLINSFKNYLNLIIQIKEKEGKVNELDMAIEKRKVRISKISSKKHRELFELSKRIKKLKKEMLFWDDEILMQDYGLYKDKFLFSNSGLYKEKLDEIRKKQKDLIKSKTATNHSTAWKIDGNKRKGNTQNNKNIRLALLAFNQQSDNIMNKIKYNNIEMCERQLIKAFDNINFLNEYNKISITDDYYELKLSELYLFYEYQQQLQLEKAEQDRIKEIMREERRVKRELEKQLKILNKEEKHLVNSLNKESTRLDNVGKEKIIDRLEEIRKEKEEVDYRVKNERAGYVYITSNIGSFGENVYKIGMTRRLDPLDRIKELSGAAVPFQYDIHAFIFSEDAPALETTLHQTFHHRRVNKMNNRKEFFKVTLRDIERVVHQNHNAKIEFTLVAEAREYRNTLKESRLIA